MATSKRKASAREGVSRAGRGSRIALVVFALALVVRLVYLGEISKSPTFQVPIVDSATYDQHARLLVAKGIFSQRFFWQGFFYPFFLAAVYFFTGGSMLWARLIQIVLGSLLCVGVCRLGSRLFDRRTGIVAGVIAALYGPLIFFDVELLDAGFSAIWALVLILLILKARDAKSIWLRLSRRCLRRTERRDESDISTVSRRRVPVAHLFVWRRASVRRRIVAARGRARCSRDFSSSPCRSRSSATRPPAISIFSPNRGRSISSSGTIPSATRRS